VTAALTDIDVAETTCATDKRDVVTFPRGILGFEDCRHFRLERNPEWEPFAKLHSLDQPRLSFVVAPPRLFMPDFLIRVDPHEVAELDMHSAADAELWAIVTIPDDPRQMSANLQGPIVINRANGKGKQVVLTRSEYSTRQLIFEPEPATA